MEKKKSKSSYITTCQCITFFIGLMLTIFSFSQGNVVDGITLIISFAIFLFSLQVFVTIIDLLEEISKKLDK